jgi:sodium/potassium-transporting ATPase subunit alpha
MFVTNILAAGKEYTPEAASDLMAIFGADNGTTELSSKTKDVMNELRVLAALCNAGEFDASTLHAPLSERKIHGDATDQAILRLSETLGSVSEVRKGWRKLFEIGFNSKNKFMVRLMAQYTPSSTDSADYAMLTIKGAPEILLSRCSSMLGDYGEIAPLAKQDKRQIEAVKDNWSRQGKRVILLARKEIRSTLPSTNQEREVLSWAREELTFVGIVGIVDPPRDEIPEVVRILRGASIRIFMVTGDFKLTAQAIAEECGIISNTALLESIQALSREPKGERERHSIVLSGPEIMSLNDCQWDQLCQYQEIVFARTTPEQKLRIVKELQARDNIVGMTGDGVNDAPSLRAADIGIAMGSGSDIAIEAADMVLLDSFAAIVEAVQYGRLVYDNLKKTIVYLLPAGSFSELCE